MNDKSVYRKDNRDNIDAQVVAAFGEEWTRYDQSKLVHRDLEDIFNQYFKIFPWDDISENAMGFDMGCGTGRWAKFVAPRIGILHCIDPSEKALTVAQKHLSDHENCRFHKAGAHDNPLPDTSADFGYSLGVLHHIPNTLVGLRQCVKKLKPGAPFLVYLYYAFDNKPGWYRMLWRLSDLLRRKISTMTYSSRYRLGQLIALFIYLPLARISFFLEKLDVNVEKIPLSFYRGKKFYIMCNDALDRFGTTLEQRFTRVEMRIMMENAGLENIQFSNDAPYWCAVGKKTNNNRMDCLHR
jgi:SAM-dependent methyltransferase